MFSKAAGRQALRRIAKRHGASFHFFECVVPRAVALRRVAKRYAKRTDLSEARPEHYDRLRAGFEPVRGPSTRPAGSLRMSRRSQSAARYWTWRDWTRLSDHRPPPETFQAALAALRRVWRV